MINIKCEEEGQVSVKYNRVISILLRGSMGGTLKKWVKGLPFTRYFLWVGRCREKVKAIMN
ncbi:hypothetical protein [Bacteroides finegoldii]|uniref:hypothetical protein n=1 Tax=Bacteroides finegoldii TaxID=338188 RepID=UPI0002DB38A6|nr:hypothetical protein [Bacteroides finegoldii]